MRPREYIIAHVINGSAAILHNLERKGSEGSLKIFFAEVDVMVIIFLFLFTNSNAQTPTDANAKMQSTLEPMIIVAKSEEARYIDFETILQREFQRRDKWIMTKQLQLAGINLIHFIVY